MEVHYEIAEVITNEMTCWRYSIETNTMNVANGPHLVLKTI